MRYNTNTFIEEARRIHGDKYDYSKVEYINSKTKICIICHKIDQITGEEHGEFWQKPSDHLQGQGCPKCYGNMRLTTERFIKLAKLIHGDKYDYSKVVYKNNRTKVCIIFPEHGEFWIIPDSHLRGRGCKKCGINRRNEKNRMDISEFKRREREVHGDKYDLSKVKYINTETKVCIICPEHGEFWQTPHHHLNGHGCPYCGANNISELKLYTLIHSIYPDAIYQYKPIFLNRQTLDIFIPSKNIAIEYQGRQHFMAIKKFGGEEGFKETSERDIRKFKLCQNNNIKIIYFTYEKKYPKNYFGNLFINENKILKYINNSGII